MMKTLFAATILGLALSVPANAMDMMKCDDASMTKMQTDMDAMTDPNVSANKDMAMKQMEMAKTSMAAGKMDECSQQMSMAAAYLGLKCDTAAMKKLREEVEAMTDASAKDMTLKEVEMAETAMTAANPEECQMHMGKAMEGSMATQ